LVRRADVYPPLKKLRASPKEIAAYRARAKERERHMMSILEGVMHGLLARWAYDRFDRDLFRTPRDPNRPDDGI
jgi:hypothetical protein